MDGPFNWFSRSHTSPDCYSVKFTLEGHVIFKIYRENEEDPLKKENCFTMDQNVFIFDFLPWAQKHFATTWVQGEYNRTRVIKI